MICAVTVVPILAPMTMDTACFRFSTPAPIRATVRTMVAVELWITAVTSAPVRTPITTFPVTFSSTRFSAAPELFFRPSPISSMPYRNRASPPRSCTMALKISI